MGQAGMKNNWKRNTRYMGVFAVLAADFLHDCSAEHQYRKCTDLGS